MSNFSFFPTDVQAEDAPSARHSLRRVQQPSRTLGVGRGRRPNMHFSSGGLSPSGARDAVDPIAELLSQLSGVRRAAAVPYDRLLHRHGGSSGSQQSAGQGSSGSASGTARRSVFPPPPSSQAVILTDTASLQQSNNNQETGSTKLDKYQFLLDKYVSLFHSHCHFQCQKTGIFLSEILIVAFLSVCS